MDIALQHLHEQAASTPKDIIITFYVDDIILTTSHPEVKIL